MKILRMQRVQIWVPIKQSADMAGCVDMCLVVNVLDNNSKMSKFSRGVVCEVLKVGGVHTS